MTDQQIYRKKLAQPSMQGGVPQFAQSLFIVQLLATLVNLLCIGLVILGLVKLGTVTTNTTWGEKRKMRCFAISCRCWRRYSAAL